MLNPAGERSYQMTAMLWFPFIAKVLATALVVVSASVAAEALGPVWGAIIACLPAATGPAYVFLAMQHGPDFVATSALNSAAANAATGLFLITYGILARRMPAWRSLGAAVAVWLAVSLMMQRVVWTPVEVVALNLAVYGPGLIFINKDEAAGTEPAQPARRRWFDLPLRAAAVAAFVSMVVTVSAALGPAATGIAAMFPISLISLIIILRPRLGGPAAGRLALNALPPMLGFGVLMLAMHLAIKPWGVAAALGLALAVSILWSGALLLLQARGRYG